MSFFYLVPNKAGFTVHVKQSLLQKEKSLNIISLNEIKFLRFLNKDLSVFSYCSIKLTFCYKDIFCKNKTTIDFELKFFFII